jgi:hypothetical protein
MILEVRIPQGLAAHFAEVFILRGMQVLKGAEIVEVSEGGTNWGVHPRGFCIDIKIIGLRENGFVRI